MNGNNFLLDTNIVLYLLGGDKILARLLDNKMPYLSFITEMELLSSGKITSGQEKQVKDFLKESSVIEMNKEIKHSAIHIRRASGLKLPDSIIAATAIFLNVPLLTADTEFNRLKSLNILQYRK